MKILIVDDDAEILELLRSFLESLKHTVTATESSIEAIKFVTTETYDVAFLDIVIPEKDGITTLKEIKKLDPRLPVVMITGFKDADRVIEAYRSGALDCLLKPFNFDYIKDTVLPQIMERKK